MLAPSGECRDSGNEIRYKNCPACINDKWGVSMNPNTGAWYCYRCGGRGTGEARAPSVQDLFKQRPAKKEWPEVPLPEYVEMGGLARLYLRNRGLHSPEKYGVVELCETTRLLFPYLGPEGKVIYWSTRCYEPDGMPKYMTAPGRHPLYVLPRWEPHEKVVLVEGIFDAIMTHEYTGLPVVALGGKVLPNYLLGDLRYLAPGEKVVMLDGDAMAASWKLRARLTNCTVKMLPPGVDPAQFYQQNKMEDDNE